MAIWHSHQSDKSQREMLISAATEVLRFKSPKALACIRWLKDTTDKFSPFRNDPAHTPMSIAAFESGIVLIEPNIFAAKSQSVTRLYEKPLESTWKKLRGDLFMLCAYAIELNRALNNSQFAPLPRRPRLLSIPSSGRRTRRKRRAREKRGEPS